MNIIKETQFGAKEVAFWEDGNGKTFFGYDIKNAEGVLLYGKGGFETLEEAEADLWQREADTDTLIISIRDIADGAGINIEDIDMEELELRIINDITDTLTDMERHQ